MTNEALMNEFAEYVANEINGNYMVWGVYAAETMRFYVVDRISSVFVGEYLTKADAQMNCDKLNMEIK